MKVVFDAPLGADTFYDGYLGMMQFYVTQLNGFLDLPKTPDERKYIEADIRGYEAIIASGSEENAKTFMNVKHAAIRAGDRFKNNEVIVDYLKATGRWIYKGENE